MARNMKTKFQTPGETYEDRESYWLQRITEARKYPGGIQKYCRDHDISKEIYYHWFGRVKHLVEGWTLPLDTNRKRRKHPPKVKSDRGASKPRSKKEWSALVAECVHARLKPSAFARKHSLSKVTFCRWYRRLSKEPSQVIPRKDSSEPCFVAVNVIDSGPAKTEQNVATLSSIEIVLHNGRTIRVQEQFKPDLLKAVISILEEC
jgi:hypothetical protein